MLLHVVNLVEASPFNWTSFIILVFEAVVMSRFIEGFFIDVALTFKFFVDITRLHSSGISFLDDAEVRFNVFSPVVN